MSALQPIGDLDLTRVPKHKFSLTTMIFCILIPLRFRSHQVIQQAAKRLNFSDQQSQPGLRNY